MDNAQDKARKGRARSGLKGRPDLAARGDRHVSRLHPERVPRGSRHGMAKLDDEKVRDIRSSRAGGESVTAIARRHGIARSTVQGVLSGSAWKHVEQITQAAEEQAA